MPVDVAVCAPAAPAPPTPAQPTPRALYAAVFAVALLAAIVPLWLSQFTGMIDYIPHLTRCYILAHFHASALWSSVYNVQFGPIPNLAMDVIVVPLAHWLPLELSGKLFLTLTAVLYVTGCDALGRAAWGRRHPMALLAALTFFNTNLLDGRLNFVFGLALFFWVFAFWFPRRLRITAPRFVLLCLLSVLVYLAHLGAIAVLGVACVAIAALDLCQHRNLRRSLASVGWLACPTLLLLFGFLRRNGRVGRLAWGTAYLKSLHLMTLVRLLEHPRLEVALLLACAGCAALLAWRARWRREFVVAGLALLACYLVTPKAIFTANYADARFVAPAFVLLMLALRPRPGRGPALVLAAVALMFLFRVALISRDWARDDASTRRVLAMGATLPPGARVDVLETTLGKSGAGGFRRFILAKTVAYLSVTRGVYMSNVFALAGQQPLIQRPGMAVCWPTGAPPDVAEAQTGPACLAHFDYVFVDAALPPLLALLRSRAVPVATWRTFTLWRLRSPAS